MLFAREFLTDQSILRDSAAPTSPAVSVVLPTYSRCKNGMLERAISSVLSQTCRDLELLVIDDGSTDGSFDLIEQFRERDPRVVHVRHERNSGIHSIRLNEGLELARGRYLICQFDDDCWRPNALQVLVAEAARHAEPVVVVGHAHFSGQRGEWTLPDAPVNLATLYDHNRLGNNTVLFPAEAIHHYGMYDCHIAMRRLCDWDLWLRYIRVLPFVVVDQVISDVFESNPGSLGLTVPWDLALFRFVHNISRAHLLTPNQWHDYPVDSLEIGDARIPNAIRRRVYEDQIVPYYFKFRHHFPRLEGFQATLSGNPRAVLHATGEYDYFGDLRLGNYDALSNARGQYKAYTQPLSEIEADWTGDSDALLLVRTADDAALDLIDQCVNHDVPVGYYPPDDLAAPSVRAICKRTDTVWATHPSMAQSVQPLNPRVVPSEFAVPAQALPTQIRPRQVGRPLRIGYVAWTNQDPPAQVWDALQRLSRDYAAGLEFNFWGVAAKALPRLVSPVVPHARADHYAALVHDLQASALDVMIGGPEPHPVGALASYAQVALAGALGVFADVPEYATLPTGLTCLKAADQAEDWYRVLRGAVSMPLDQFDLLRERALAHVREEFTDSARIFQYEAACRATEFHAHTRAARSEQGRPRVLYVFHSGTFGGAEVQLWRHACLARDYGIEPIVVLPEATLRAGARQDIADTCRLAGVQVEFVPYTCFDEPRSPTEFLSEVEQDAVRSLLRRYSPALVHTITFVASFGQVCTELGIPHVATLYAIDEDFNWLGGYPDFSHSQIAHSDTTYYGRRWSKLLEVEEFCARGTVPDQVFGLGQRRYLESIGSPAAARQGRVKLALIGTLQRRKQQLEAIQAVGQLVREGWDCQLDLYGYTHFFPEYLEECKQRIRENGLDERVTFRGFSDDVMGYLTSADVVLSVSTFESFPGALKEAMAAGVLIVATAVGGVSELIVDRVTGILCENTSLDAITGGIRRALALAPEERRRIVEQARRVARSELVSERSASDLFQMYNRAIRLVGPGSAHVQRAATLQPPAATGASARSVAPPQAAAGTVPLDRRLVYRITAHHANWTGIDVTIGTHGRKAHGSLCLRILTPTGQLLRECSADLSRARDNSWVRFRFDPVADSAGLEYRLEFTVAGAAEHTLVSLYDSKPPQERGKRLAVRLLRRLGFASPMDSLYYRMWYAQPPTEHPGEGVR